MRQWEKWARAAGAIAACLLAGCTTGRHSGESASNKSAGGAGGMTLRIPLVREPSQTDPAKVQDVITGELFTHIFEGLVRFNDKNEIEPALAEKWDVSHDGLTYTFHLRANVTFHNGQPFGADDVLASWKHALSPKTASGVAAGYLDGVLGVKEFAAGRATELSGVTVLDPQTLQVKIDHPRAYFLSMLPYISNVVQSGKVLEANGGVVDAKTLIGTGPFKLDSYEPGKRVVLVANAAYWGGKPTLDRIEQPIILDTETLYNNFQTSAIDAWMISLPSSRYVQDQSAGKLSAEWHTLPYGETDFLAFQPEKQPVFKNKTVRQAIAMAIDRQQIFRTAYHGVGTLADGFLPAAMPLRGAPVTPYAYDPSKARQLLTQAGFPGGKGFPMLTLTYTEKSPDAAATGQLIQAELKNNLGIAVNLQELELGQYFDAERRRELEFYQATWIADYPDPQDFLSLLFVSTSALNRTEYRNADVDRLCAQADGEKDSAKRADLYGRANALIMADAPVIPLVFPPRLALVHTNVQGWKYNMLNVLPFRNVTVGK